MIKRIELVNFMSHEHSVFDLTEGLNVLVGPNNCGKSAVVTALQVLCYNDPSKFALRHDAKECSILLETDDGHVVRWARKKNGSPYYEIDGQRYDRLGKGKNSVPEQLQQVLRLDRVSSEKDQFDVHFGEQRQPVFLLNEKARLAADFFASSSDAKHLLEMQTLHKQNVRDAGQQQKRLQREAAELEASLKRLTPLTALAAEMDRAEETWRRLDEADQRRLHLVALCKGVTESEKEISSHQRKLKHLESVPVPPQFHDESKIAAVIESLVAARDQCQKLARMGEVLEAITEPPRLEQPGNIEDVIDSLRERLTQQKYLAEQVRLLEALPVPPQQSDDEQLRQLTKAIGQKVAERDKLKKQSTKLDKQLKEVTHLIKDWAEANPACPTCGGDVTMKQLIQGGHQHGG